MIKTMKEQQGVQAYFSTRLHGYSETPFKSLNVGFHVGDNKFRVDQNHLYIKSFFTLNNELIYMKQEHADHVCVVGSQGQIPVADSLITDKSGKILMVMVADCIPILFYDAEKKVIAAIHAGRKGTFLNIVSQTLKQMKTVYSCLSQKIHVSIGPHLHNCCYEVGKEIVLEANALGYDYAITEEKNHYFLDMQAIIIKQLTQDGIKSENIEALQTCTSCHVEEFFSYRKEGQTGRFCGVIMLK